MEILCVKEVEQNPLPKSQTKPFYIGTKEAPSEDTSVGNRLRNWHLGIIMDKALVYLLRFFGDLCPQENCQENSRNYDENQGNPTDDPD